MAKSKPKTPPGTIVANRKARHDFTLVDRFEAGLELLGWEVKALRAGRAQLVDSYVFVQNGEAWLYGAHINPLESASTHVIAEPTRLRKLLLHKKEIAKLFSASAQKGHTCVATALYWKNNKVKCEVAIAIGKKEHDKRAAVKEREWNLEKRRVLKEAS